MPKKNGVSDEHLARIENHIAEIIEGRFALIDLEAMLVAAMKHDGLPADRREKILKILSDIRRAIDLGHEYAKKARGRSGQ